jgi:hypothetical protein
MHSRIALQEQNAAAGDQGQASRQQREQQGDSRSNGALSVSGLGSQSENTATQTVGSTETTSTGMPRHALGGRLDLRI